MDKKLTVLADWMESQELSNAELARRLGVTRAAVSNWVKGKSNIDVLYAFAIVIMSNGELKTPQLIPEKWEQAIKLGVR